MVDDSTPSTGGFPRIKQDAFIVLVFCLLAIAIIAAAFRTLFRLHQSRRLETDDALLGIAIVTLCASAGIIHASRDLIYYQVRLSLGLPVKETPDTANQLLYYHKLEVAASVLLFTTIFAVKFSFLFFFRRLIHRVRPLEIWWYVVMGIMIPAAGICIPLGFWICSDFGSSFLKTCPPPRIVHRETIYLHTTVFLDILTDVLIISIPTALLWRVNIDIWRKVAIGAVLGLSVLMIVIAIIRVALAPLPRAVTDSVWIFFWQFVEAAAAVVMVSLTAIRSLFGIERKGRGGSARMAASADRYITLENVGGSEGSGGRKVVVQHTVFPLERRSQAGGTMFPPPAYL